MMSELTVKTINAMSYTDFVGFINQWNVLPGSYVTLSKWSTFSQLNENSNILEIACTTGFSSRELALLRNCSGKAFDLSKISVDAANENKKMYASDIKVQYFVQDGYAFETEERFSHIILGAALKFFPDPQRMLKKCISLLKSGGFLLASPFYIIEPIPESLVAGFEKVFGIRPTVESYKDIMKLYRSLRMKL